MIQIVKIVKPKCKHVIGGEQQLLYKHTYITLKNYIQVKVGPHNLPFFSVFGTLKCYVIFKKSKCKIYFSSVCLIHLYSLTVHDVSSDAISIIHSFTMYLYPCPCSIYAMQFM